MLNPVSNSHQPPPVPPYLLAQSISPKVIAGSEVKSPIVVYSIISLHGSFHGNLELENTWIRH